VESPKRELIPSVKAGIPVINKIQPAILKRTAVRLDLSKSERVKRASVLGADLDNHLVVITSFFDRDHFCGKGVHGFTYIRSAAAAIFGSGKEPKEERIQFET
jgi:hypothetical protein